MALLLDTSVLIAIERGPNAIAELSTRVAQRASVISAVTLAELRLGQHLADASERARVRAHFIDTAVRLCLVVPFGEPEAEEYARLSARLRRAGTPIGDHDLQIAATAVAGGHQLSTLNTAEFARVPGLTLVSP